MKINLLIFCVVILALVRCNSSPENQNGEMESKNSNADISFGKVSQLAAGFSFTEGPAADAKGNVYFTDQPNNRIFRWSVSGKLDTVTNYSGRSNGLFFDENQNLIACADSANQLWQLNDAGKLQKVLVDHFRGKVFNGPNDLWIDDSNGIYFTDPLYEREYWKGKHGELTASRNVYYLASGSDSAVVVADGFKQPNGIVGDAESGVLFVSDIDADTTYRYKILAPGKLSQRTFFVAKGSDGMTLDKNGNVYLTGNGVFVFDSVGDSIAHIQIDEDWTGNVCFGGQNGETLFITASKGLYSVPVKFDSFN